MNWVFALGCLGVFGLAIALFLAPVVLPMLGLAGLFGWAMWTVRPVTVTATVSDRTYVRQEAVRRLVPNVREAPETLLPEPAGLPGSGALKPGRGEIHSCDIGDCYPRPEHSLVQVVDHKWKRSVFIDRIVETHHTGWKRRMPARGRRPAEGDDGKPGAVDVSCRPQRNRDEDLEDWCRWEEIRFELETSQSEEGSLDSPRWPLLVAGPGERRRTKSDSYVIVDTVAGEVAPKRVKVSDDALDRAEYAPDALLYWKGHVAKPVPPDLIPPGPAHDCGPDIPSDELVQRDICTYDHWDWADEPPVQSRGPQRPEWPAVDLRDDGVSTRSEWAVVTLDWTADRPGSKKVRTTPAEADAWPVGRQTEVSAFPDGRMWWEPEVWPEEDRP